MSSPLRQQNQKQAKVTNESERDSPPAGLPSPPAVWPAATVNQGGELTTHQSAASTHTKTRPVKPNQPTSSDLQLHQKHLVIFCLDLLFMHDLASRQETMSEATPTTHDHRLLPASVTFLTGGLTTTSSKPSSALTVWKFSCRMAIFFSLSQPDGLPENRRDRFQTDSDRARHGDIPRETHRMAYMKTASLSTTCAEQWKGKP